MQHRCGANSICVNTPGDHQCKCKEGFEGDGQVCKRKSITWQLLTFTWLTGGHLAQTDRSTDRLLCFLQLYVNTPASTVANVLLQTRALAEEAITDIAVKQVSKHELAARKGPL